MQIDTTAARPARAARIPSAPLILRTLPPSRSSNPAATPRADSAARTAGGPAELQAVREAWADPRTTHERVLDAVVDRLMKELTW